MYRHVCMYIYIHMYTYVMYVYICMYIYIYADIRRSFAATRLATRSTGCRAEWAADEVLEQFVTLHFQHRLISKKKR